jgi:SAM-dependent methyltransferase
MEYTGKQNLEILEEMAPRYNLFLAKKFSEIFLGLDSNKNKEILDFGAGIGSLAIEMKKLGFSDVHCLEIDEGMLEVIKERGLTTFPSLDSLTTKYSHVYMSNVLEHIEDDLSLLLELSRKALNSAGVLVVYVPAFPFLFSKMDEQVGHFRRYKMGSLRKVVESAGFKVQRAEYVDSLGFVSLLVLKTLLGSKLNLPSSKGLVSIYDKCIFPISRGLDRLGLHHWFGKNLLLVAQQR